MKSNDSLQIIMEMIEGAKGAYQRVSPFFLAWGILLSIAGIGEYLLVYQVGTKFGFFIWPVIGMIGGFYSFLLGRKEGQNGNVKTYYDLVFHYLWGGFAITLVLIITMSVINKINPTPFVLLLTALPTFISGGLVKSSHLKIGGVIFWISGVIAFVIPVELTGPLFSVAILLGYVWPGLQLRKSENLKSN